MTNQEAIIKKYNLFLPLLLLISIGAFIVQAYFVSQIKFIGTSDPAHYAEAAENVLKGNGFTLDYLNQYIIRFNSISHPEEWGFSGASILIAPFILLLGKTPFAVKLPSMIIGIILFPILTYFLGKEFFNERVGFLAAVSFIFYPTIFPIHFGGERDTMFAFFVVAGIYFFYRGLKTDQTKYFLLMGVFLGFSYLIRQATIAVWPAIILAYYLINKKFSWKFISGLLISTAVVSPSLIRNYLIFGDPFFTVNRYTGWIMGYASFFEEQFFSVYWNAVKPSLYYVINLTQPHPFYLIYTRRLFESLAGQFTNSVALNILTFIGIALATRKTITKKLLQGMAFLVIFGIGAFLFTKFVQITTFYKVLIYVILLAIPYAGLLLISLFFFREGKENTTFIIFWGTYALFFSAIWIHAERYWLAIVPFLLVYSWFAIEKIIEKTMLQQISRILMLFVIILIVFSLPFTYGKFLDKNALFPFKDDQLSQDKMFLAEKVSNITEKDAIIMGCDVAVFHFYNGRKYLEFPSTEFGTLETIIRTYNVSYFTLLGCERRGIEINVYKDLFGDNLARVGYEAKGENIVLVKDYAEKSIYKIALPKTYKERLYKVEYRANETIARITIY